MALLDKLHALIDPSLEATFSRKPYNVEADRAWVVKRLEANRNQFSATERTRGGGKRWWQLSNGVVAFSPVRPDRQPLIINGQTTNFIDAANFDAFVSGMIEAVNGGAFDEELKADSVNGSTVALDTAPRKARKPRDPSTAGSRGWTDERRARYAETIAARRATQG